MVSFIPADIIRKLFLLLLEEDKRSLHQCIFVNKEWFENAAPLLWRNPFKVPFNDRAIARSYFGCLPEESKLEIQTKGINIILPSFRQPLLNYITYCQEIRSQSIKNISSELLDNKFAPNFIWEYNLNLVEKELWKCLLAGCVLRTIDLPNLSLTYFSYSLTTFSNLNELECSSSISTDFFFELSIICQNLEKIVVELLYCSYDNEGLATLIAFQKRLKSIEFSTKSNYDYKNLGNALGTQAKTLTHLKFSGDICVNSESLSLLTNLKCLEVRFHTFRNLGIGILHFVTFPCLEDLTIIYPFEQPLELYVKLIKGTKGELRKIDIDSSPWPYIATKQYVQSISRFCPKLEFVKIWYDNESELENIEKILTCCRLLKCITIDSLYHYGELGRCNAKIIFDLLVEKSGPHLSKIYFNGLWDFSEDELEGFLNGWEKKGRSPLSIYFDMDDVIFDQHVHIFRKYHDLGVLSFWESYQLHS
ncbi:5411_t:CDS:1 [Funneliformis geosporum]|uniref:9601_t:CDS:1 n=1 Tax=Funneliformis geosporum TaxID=1117311 RepID=A0A9W4SDB9_9GLOM|nr:9601_t:CDS:1 [Funneliformis geosporum]CAI2180599.1 5411_t:CDS:1 [Funneliformis geosporum]